MVLLCLVLFFLYCFLGYREKIDGWSLCRLVQFFFSGEYNEGY